MIPEINIHDPISTERFNEIFTTYGSALLTNVLNNGEQKIMDQWIVNTKEYFAQDVEIRKQIPHDKSQNIGYQKMGGWYSPTIERYHFYKNRMQACDWDEIIDQDLALAIVNINDKISNRMLQLFDESLGTGTQIIDAHKQAWNTTAIMHYHPSKKDSPYTRGGSHNDWGTITFFWQLESSGLEMKHIDGTWHDVQNKENSVAVCIGNTLQRLSNDFYKSTLHQVGNSELNKSRYSMPHFVVPQPNTIVKNLTSTKDIYKPIGLKDFLYQTSKQIKIKD